MKLPAWLLAVLAFFGCASQMRAPLSPVDTYVYRSGQPTTAAEWDAVVAAHVTDIIKLNFPSEGGDDSEAEKRGIVVHRLPIQPEGDVDVFDEVANMFRRPDPALVAQADALLATAGPRLAGGDRVLLVHCKWGHDRTGYIVMRYRVRVNDWTKQHAHDEAVQMGYHAALRGLEDAWEDWKP